MNITCLTFSDLQLNACARLEQSAYEQPPSHKVSSGYQYGSEKSTLVESAANHPSHIQSGMK